MFALTLALVFLNAALQTGLCDTIPVRGRVANRVRRAVDEDKFWDVSTECCEMAAPKDDTLAKFEDISDKCIQQLKRKYGFKYYTDDDSGSTSKEVKIIDESFTSGNNESTCFYDCILQNFQAIGEDGEIIPEKALVYVRWVTPLRDENLWNAIYKCDSSSRKTKGNFVCNIAAIDYMDCIVRVSDENCPEENRIKSENCSKSEEDFVE
ncbi:hypothetical protein L9F63_017262 [Diploptera punctata]|uniref:Odorant-binding protein n=1 Tax=Diploptera punctata TaxID=6984 RepID=A0AAD8EGI5_DIPPU|nr:hypothetical protein L9F63_017262 [Diploptera punctata]